MRIQLRVSIPRKHRGRSRQRTLEITERNELVGLPHGDTRGGHIHARTNTSDAGGLYPIEAGGLTVL